MFDSRLKRGDILPKYKNSCTCNYLILLTNPPDMVVRRVQIAIIVRTRRGLQRFDMRS